MASKTVTREQAQRKKEQAAAMMERFGDPDRAADFEGMTVDEYAEHKGLTLTNPRRRYFMPNNGPTKADLQSQLDSIEELLDSAYQVEASREDMAQAIGQALDILQEGEEEEPEESEEDDDSNGD